MRAIVHIGLQKTGTASIQSWLHRNAASLPARGIAYGRIPFPGKAWRRAHVEIGICQFAEARILRGNKATQRAYGFTDLDSRAAVAATYDAAFGARVRRNPEEIRIFSSEDISSESRDADSILALDRWLSRHFDEVRYIACLRRQEGWLPSSYSTRVRRGLRLPPIDTFLEKNGVQDYHAFASLWAGAIGGDRLTLRLLELHALKAGDLTADFADAIGFDASGMPMPERSNESLSVAAADFINRAAARGLFKARGVPVANDRLKKVDAIQMRQTSGDRKLALTDRQVARVRKINAASNERLRAKFFSRLRRVVPLETGSGIRWSGRQYTLGRRDGRDRAGDVAGRRLRRLCRKGGRPPRQASRPGQVRRPLRCGRCPGSAIRGDWMSAVFHIGRPKCGSTTLQVFLAENQEALAGQGLFYDRIDPDISSQWEFPIAALASRGALPPDLFVRRMLGIDDIEDARAYSDRMMQRFEQGLVEASPDMHTWVASSEHVFPYMTKPGRITAVNDLLKRYFDDVTYVVYLRRREDLVASAYSEAVGRGRDIGLDAFVKGFLDDMRGNHMQVLRKWLWAVGKDRIEVRLLERDALVNGDLVVDFCQILGGSLEGLRQPESHNQSLTQDSLEAFRLINRHIASVETDDPWRQSLRDRLCEAAEDWGRNGPALALPRDVSDRIRRRLAQSNDLLGAEFFPDRAELFPEQPPMSVVPDRIGGNLDTAEGAV